MEHSVSVPGVPFGLFTQGPSAAASWSVSGESLNMHASAQTDMFVDPARSASGTQLEVLRLVGEVTGDFQLSAQVEVQFKAAFDASADGQHWQMIRYFSLGPPPSTPLNVGFLAQSPTGEGCLVTFEYIRFTTTSLTGLRDGS